MIHPEHDSIQGLITYLNYRKDTGYSAARVDADQEESWAAQIEELLEELRAARAMPEILGKFR